MKDQCTLLSSIKCDLGEGLIWDSNSSRLLMTDIMNCKLIELDINSDTCKNWQFNEPLAWVLQTTIKDKFLLGLKSGILLFDSKQPNNMHWVNRDFPGTSQCRLNDACVDSTGRVWYGSMNMINPSSSDGQLASFSLKDGFRILDSGFTVTNGPLISPDEKYLFLNDTMRGTVYRYRLEIDTGQLHDRQVFTQFSSDQGHPDGMCFDVEGNIWIALWGGSAVVQMDDKGKLIKKIGIPAPNVTNLCFCGPNLNRLIVSTASIGLSFEETQRHPASGRLFEINDHISTGLLPHPATLDSSWI